MRWARFEIDGDASYGIVGSEGHAKAMRPGDLVEAEITGIGSRRNPLIAATGN